MYLGNNKKDIRRSIYLFKNCNTYERERAKQYNYFVNRHRRWNLNANKMHQLRLFVILTYVSGSISGFSPAPMRTIDSGVI